MNETEVKIVTLLESDLPKVILSGSLSRRTTYSLRVDGPFEEREAKAILSILTAQIEILDFGPSPTKPRDAATGTGNTQGKEP